MLQGQNFARMRCPFVCMVMKHVLATESTFQPMTENDRILCALMHWEKQHGGWARFDWDRKRTLIIVLMMLMDEKEPFWWNGESGAVDN